MRVLFTVFPATAHVHPVVPLAWALQNAGHEVRVAIHPDATRLVTEAGLAAVPFASSEILADAMRWNDNFAMLDTLSDALSLDTAHADGWERQWSGLTSMLRLFTPMLDDLLAICRGWEPDLVVWDQFCVAAAVAARLTGAAHARFLWGQDNIAWLRSQWRHSHGTAAGELTEDDPVAALMSPMLAAHGLPFTEDLLLGQWTIDPMPPALRLPLDLHYEPIQRVPYNGSQVLPEWLRGRPSCPRVCLTLGIGGRGRQLFRESGVPFDEVVRGLAAMEVEVVATLHADLLATVGEVPDNVRLVEYVPLAHLLPTCAAVIHHGGGGTFAAAAAFGVPQIIVPMPFWSEATTARFVAGRGAGIVIDSAGFGVDVLRKELGRVLEDPSLRAGAESLRRELRQAPAPHEIVDVLRALTERHRS
ncbi:nucleotide disphospho-sugar-binding domain-containing protein [Actinoplanes sp. NPDC051475]|uniref:nucleotide disphospho-sugar-binding domain-containing protein n=1 Tax=Actinoplanes sp. NPDC051475 TaxID=3157225 RepID=UPI0034503D2F